MRLKSIKQILEENPDAYFTEDFGCLLLKGVWEIRPKHFRFFGSETLFEPDNEYWHES